MWTETGREGMAPAAQHQATRAARTPTPQPDHTGVRVSVQGEMEDACRGQDGEL